MIILYKKIKYLLKKYIENIFSQQKMFSILFVLVFFLNIDYSYQQTCQFSSGIEYLGLNLPNMPIYRARTITDCCNYCLANPQCQSW